MNLTVQQVLIIEDNTTKMISAKKFFEDNFPKVKVTTCSSKSEVLEFIKSNSQSTDLILLDNKLEDTENGLEELLPELRTDVYTKGAAIIFTSTGVDKYHSLLQFPFVQKVYTLDIFTVDFLSDVSKPTETEVKYCERCFSNEAFRKYIHETLLSDVLTPFLHIDLDLQTYYDAGDKHVVESLRQLSGEVKTGLAQAKQAVEKLKAEVQNRLTSEKKEHLEEIKGCLDSIQSTFLSNGFLKDLAEKLSGGNSNALAEWLKDEAIGEKHNSFHSAYKQAVEQFNKILEYCEGLKNKSAAEG